MRKGKKSETRGELISKIKQEVTKQTWRQDKNLIVTECTNTHTDTHTFSLYTLMPYFSHRMQKRQTQLI